MLRAVRAVVNAPGSCYSEIQEGGNMRTYTTYEVAARLGVNESTIRRRCMAGKLAGAYKETVRARTIWRIPANAIFGLQKPVRKEG
jgi:hypothetical protein